MFQVLGSPGWVRAWGHLFVSGLADPLTGSGLGGGGGAWLSQDLGSPGRFRVWGRLIVSGKRKQVRELFASRGQVRKEIVLCCAEADKKRNRL